MPEPIDELPPLSAQVRAYVEAFAADERPEPGADAATWAAVASQTEPRRGRVAVFVVGGLVAAAAVAWLAFGVRGSALQRDPAEPSMQTPWEGGAQETAGTPQHRGTRLAGQGSPNAASPAATTPDAQGPADPPSSPAPAASTSSSPQPEPEAIDKPKPTASTPRAGASAGRGRPPTQSAGTQPGSDPAGSNPVAVDPIESSLAAELALVREATLALKDGKPARTLEVLVEHRRRFAAGALRREGAVLRAEALCALGRTAEATVVRDRFIARHGGSPLVERMRDVCR